MYIARAHRLGRMQRNNQYQSRPIIVNFRDYCDIESIMGSARMLRGKPFSIDHDFPKEIQEARSRLWPMFKQIRRDAPDARVVLAYPAKIIKNGQIVRDELPNWQKYISVNRISQSENTYRANATNGHGGSPRYVTSAPANSEVTSFMLLIFEQNMFMLKNESQTFDLCFLLLNDCIHYAMVYDLI